MREATSAAHYWVAAIAERIEQAKRPLERDTESLHLAMTHLTAAFVCWLETDKRLDRQ